MLTDNDCELIVKRLAARRDLKKSLGKEYTPPITGFDVLLEQACAWCVTNVQEVIRLMMSPEDIEDLHKGDIPFESLKLHVKVWCEMGKPDNNQPRGKDATTTKREPGTTRHC